ncbi:DUF1971 domain-containing protein [Ilumatobacter sp.]|uniref:DUF1971 domain-containing protein n=1 Tax=Ilumatobacter sp. TaxID=1967498 RepID=UPI003C6820F8
MTNEQLPDGLTLQRSTPTFDQDTTPAGLRSAHSVAEGVWARLVVEEGSLGFVFEDAPDDVRTVAAGEHQVIPPQLPHHVVLDEPVRFAVEFHRPPDSAGVDGSSFSSGLAD